MLGFSRNKKPDFETRIDDFSLTLLHEFDPIFRVRLELPVRTGGDAVFTDLPVGRHVRELSTQALLAMSGYVPELSLAKVLVASNILPSARGQNPLPKDEIVKAHDMSAALLTEFAEWVGRHVDRVLLEEDLGKFSTKVILV